MSDLNQMIIRLDYDSFLQLVPQLRLAFAFFGPMEISMLAEKVGALFQTTAEEMTAPAVAEPVLQRARLLDDRIRGEFARWNLI
ncbi:hypothetical protein EN829_061230 [Mesorhizobium sp. M00.F.Ca.ET.186.01.1.1]|nr:hypothetical protein EN829_061230 [Mesorhizobium sp. M00.F.Ca.ET.186.01.1.1]